MTICRLFLLLVLAIGPALQAAAGPPTEGEWQPFAAALEAGGDPALRQKLTNFMGDRVWPDGWVILAGLDREAGDYEACFAHAERGLDQSLAQQTVNPHINQVRTDAAWLAIHALIQLGRPGQADAIHHRFGRHRDVAGAVAFAMAQSHQHRGNLDEAERFLTKAMATCTQQGEAVPQSYTYLQAMLYEARAAEHLASSGEDARRRAIEALEAAADCYQRALRSPDADPDALYNLARMQRQLAQALPEQRDRYLAAALESYRALRKAQPDDLECRIGLGLVLLDLDEYLKAESAFTEAINAFDDPGAEVSPSSRSTAYRGRGSARVKLAESNPRAWSFRDAYEDLTTARDAGDDTPDLWANLMVAALALKSESDDPATQERYQAVADAARDKAGDSTSLNAALANLQAAEDLLTRPATAEEERRAQLQEAEGRIASAIAAYALAVDADADEPSQWRMEDTPENRERAAVWRYLGHALALRSRIATAAGEPEAARAATEQALRAYRIAGDLVDHDARRHYLALACAHDPATGYQAGWRFLGWKTYLSLTGWGAVIGNYGASQAWKNPIHIGIWAVLIGIPLLIGLKGLLIGKKVPTGGREPRGGGTGRAGRGPSGGPQKKPAVEIPADDDSRSKDATFIPNTALNQQTGALERSDGRPRRKAADQRADAPLEDSDSRSYNPATAQQHAGPAHEPKPKGPTNKAAAQVAKRLAQQKQETPESRRSPPRRRRR